MCDHYLNITMTIFDCLQNIPANFRIKRNGLFAITIMNCNGYVHWMGNGQRYEHFLRGRILLDDFSFPRTPCERFVGEAVGGTASAARRCCNGLCTARMNSGCSETGGFPAMENALANEHLCSFFFILFHLRSFLWLPEAGRYFRTWIEGRHLEIWRIDLDVAARCIYIAQKIRSIVAHCVAGVLHHFCVSRKV